MEKGFNNSDIRRCGHFNDYQIFFIQRWLEVLNSNTHGRYSIKYLNSHQALKEVVRVCQGILNDEIKSKEIHLKLAIEEASQIVNKDILFKTESEEYHRIVRRCFSSIPKVTQIPKIYSLIYQLKYVIKHLKTHYLKWIVDRLKLLLFDSDNTNQIQDGKLEEIDSLILSLISELLGKGWSVKRLYELIKLDLLDQSDENQKWDRFLTTIMSECRTYICIFRFKQQPKELLKEKMKQFELDLLPGTYLSEEYSELSEHVSATQSYLRVAVNAYDRHSAVNTAWFQIVEKLDILRFYGFTPLEISNTPIVIGDGKLFTRNVHVSLISDKKKFKAPDTILERILNQIKKIDEKSINRKIKSLFEFNRISEESLSPQSTFLNLWIALESFVQTKEREGGIENVKMVVGATTSYNYIYSLVKNFIEDCQRCNLLINREGDEFIEIGRLKVSEAIYFLLDDDNQEIILNSCNHYRRINNV